MNSLFAELTPIPNGDFNKNLTSADEATMLKLLEWPGRLSNDCSMPVMSLAHKMKHQNVGPFSVWGLGPAVDSLTNVFSDVFSAGYGELFNEVKSDGMLCVRARRPNPKEFSNHSWGTALDVYFGLAAAPQGQLKCQRGVLALVPFFNKHGWYWGGGFSGNSVDSMHFEIALETITEWRNQGLV